MTLHTYTRPLCCFCHCPLAKDEGNDPWPFVQAGMCCDDCDDNIVYPSRCVVLGTPRTDADKVH